MEITDTAIMIVNWVREIKSIHPTPPAPSLSSIRDKGVKERGTRGLGRAL